MLRQQPLSARIFCTVVIDAIQCFPLLRRCNSQSSLGGGYRSIVLLPLPVILSSESAERPTLPPFKRHHQLVYPRKNSERVTTAISCRRFATFHFFGRTIHTFFGRSHKQSFRRGSTLEGWPCRYKSTVCEHVRRKPGSSGNDKTGFSQQSRGLSGRGVKLLFREIFGLFS